VWRDLRLQQVQARIRRLAFEFTAFEIERQRLMASQRVLLAAPVLPARPRAQQQRTACSGRKAFERSLSAQNGGARPWSKARRSRTWPAASPPRHRAPATPSARATRAAVFGHCSNSSEREHRDEAEHQRAQQQRRQLDFQPRASGSVTTSMRSA
jgi:hypothetical protein